VTVAAKFWFRHVELGRVTTQKISPDFIKQFANFIRHDDNEDSDFEL
jgi:hypothetical protein